MKDSFEQTTNFVTSRRFGDAIYLRVNGQKIEIRLVERAGANRVRIAVRCPVDVEIEVEEGNASAANPR